MMSVQFLSGFVFEYLSVHHVDYSIWLCYILLLLKCKTCWVLSCFLVREKKNFWHYKFLGISVTSGRKCSQLANGGDTELGLYDFVTQGENYLQYFSSKNNGTQSHLAILHTVKPL